MKISDRLKLCRLKLGLSQEEVGKLTNISQPSYQKIEKGLVKTPTRLQKLAEVFKTTPEWLLFGVGEPPEYIEGEKKEQIDKEIKDGRELIKCIKIIFKVLKKYESW